MIEKFNATTSSVVVVVGESAITEGEQAKLQQLCQSQLALEAFVSEEDKS